MSFFEERFPDDIAQGAMGGPSFKTSEVKVSGGARSANKDWSAPLHFFNVASGIKSRDDFKIARSFFWVVFGAFDGFRFKDFSDYACMRSESILTLVSGSNWQLGKRYVYGSRGVTRTIKKPVAGSVIVYDVGGSALPTVLDATTGIATVTGTPATWAGEFDVPCKFSNDKMDARQIGDDDGMFIDWGSIDIEELRNP